MVIPEVSSTDEVLEGLRRNIIARLRSQDIKVPAEALDVGNCFQAVLAHQRLAHRSLPVAPRKVLFSPELQASCQKNQRFSAAVQAIRGEFERGDDMTQRLTRYFFRSGFNDFLFNNFQIQHFHLGARNSARDRTRKHEMAAGDSDVLFAWVTPAEAYFLDIAGHEVFDNAHMSKTLVQIALRDRPEFVEEYVVPGVTAAEQSFEDAFDMAKAGFTTIYELDGRFLLTGDTVMDGKVGNGRRAPCTSVRVVDATNYVLNRVVELVEFLRENSEEIAKIVASFTGIRPARLVLEVVEFGRVVLLRDDSSGVEFGSEGNRRGYRVPGTAQFVPLELSKPMRARTKVSHSAETAARAGREIER